jgi:hypothetical protein
MSAGKIGDPVNIGGKPVGEGHPCYVVAEIGINHNGDLDIARKLIDAAAWPGATRSSSKIGRWRRSIPLRSCQAPGACRDDLVARAIFVVGDRLASDLADHLWGPVEITRPPASLDCGLPWDRRCR